MKRTGTFHNVLAAVHKYAHRYALIFGVLRFSLSQDSWRCLWREKGPPLLNRGGNVAPQLGFGREGEGIPR